MAQHNLGDRARIRATDSARRPVLQLRECFVFLGMRCSELVHVC